MIPAAFGYHRGLVRRRGPQRDRGGRRRRQGHRRRPEPAAADEDAPRQRRDPRGHRPARRSSGASGRCPTAAWRSARSRPTPRSSTRPRCRSRSRPSRDIGDVQVRNRGTVGGAVAHADPASGPAGAGSRARLLGGPPLHAVVSGSSRSTGSSRAPFQTGDGRGRAHRRAAPRTAAGRASGAYRKLAQPASGYSIVGVAAVVAKSGGSVSHVRVAITGVGEVAYRAKAVEAALAGSGRLRRRRRRRRGPRHRRRDRQQRHPRGQRVSDRDGRGLHATRARGRAGPLRLRAGLPAYRTCGSNGSPQAAVRRRAWLGAILARDLTSARTRWSKGRRLYVGRPAARAGRRRARSGGHASSSPKPASCTRTTRPCGWLRPSPVRA